MTIAPTTAIGVEALVRDIRGVWSRGETWRMTFEADEAGSMKDDRVNRSGWEFILTSVLGCRFVIAQRA